jgi:PEP-CTERM motif
MRKFRLPSILILALVSFSPAARASIVIYGVSGSTLYTVDPASAALTAVATLSGDAPGGISPGLEYYGGLLYGTSFGSPSYTSMVSIDPVTGVTTLVAAQPSSNLKGLAVNPATGIFYSIDATTGQLYAIDLGGGPSFTPIGLASPDSIDGMAFGDGLLYGVNDSGLYEIDTTTGVRTVRALFSEKPDAGLAFDPESHLLYMTSHSTLFTINPGTGDVAGIGSNDGISGLAIVPAAVPEPGTISVVLAGLGGVWLVRRRRA